MDNNEKLKGFGNDKPTGSREAFAGDNFERQQALEHASFFEKYKIDNSSLSWMFRTMKSGLMNQPVGYKSLFTIIEGLNWYTLFRSSISIRRNNSADWKAGLRILTKELEQKKENKHCELGFRAATLGVDIEIPSETAKDSADLRYYLPEVLEGAGIAHLMPELQEQLALLEGRPVQIDWPLGLSTSTTQNSIAATPIQWNKSARLLGYLLQRLEREGYINTDDKLNKAIKEHFIDKNGACFKDSVRQNRSNTANNTGKNIAKPKEAELIEKIIDDLKNEEQ